MKDAYKSPRFKVGDTIRIYNKSGKSYLKTIKEVHSSWYIFTDGKRYNFGGQDRWELVSETDFGKNGLREFEQCLKSGTNIYVEQGRHMEDWDAKEDAKELLNIALGTFITNTCDWLYDKLNNGDIECGNIEMLITDYRKTMGG